MAERWQRTRRIAPFERFFARYVRWLVRRSFATVWLRVGANPLPSGGYVAAANHASWWDGFLPYLLHRETTAHAPFALMMSDAELRRFPFFRWGGAFSVDASTPRRAYAAVRYAAEEARGGAGVWIFPQGRFARDGVSFTSGFVHAARLGGVPIVPVALRVAMLARQRPEAFIDVAPAQSAERRDAVAYVQQTVEERLRRIDTDIATAPIGSRYRPLLSERPAIDTLAASVARLLRR